MKDKCSSSAGNRLPPESLCSDISRHDFVGFVITNEIFMSITRNYRERYNALHESKYTMVNQGIFSGFGFYTLISILA